MQAENAGGPMQIRRGFMKGSGFDWVEQLVEVLELKLEAMG